MRSLLLTLLSVCAALVSSEFVSAQAAVPAHFASITATTLTPVIVSTGGPGTLPLVDSLPPGASSGIGLEVEVVARGAGGALISTGSSVLHVSSTTERVSIAFTIDVRVAATAPVGTRAQSPPHEYLVTVQPQAPLDGDLTIETTDLPGPGAASMIEVDLDNDGSVDARASAGARTLMRLPRVRFRTAPIVARFRASFQSTALGVSSRSFARISLDRADVDAVEIAPSCHSRCRLFALPLLDGGVLLLAIDSLTLREPLALNALLLGMPLASPVPLPGGLNTLGPCTLAVQPAVVVDQTISQSLAMTLYVPGSLPLNLRPFDMSAQLIGARSDQGQISTHSSQAFTLRFR